MALPLTKTLFVAREKNPQKRWPLSSKGEGVKALVAGPLKKTPLFCGFPYPYPRPPHTQRSAVGYWINPSHQAGKRGMMTIKASNI